MSRLLAAAGLCVTVLFFCGCNENNKAANKNSGYTDVNKKAGNPQSTTNVINTSCPTDNEMHDQNSKSTYNSIPANYTESAQTGINNSKDIGLYKKYKTRLPGISGNFMGEFPEGSERRLTDRDVTYLSQWGLKIMLNEIYARHGMKFTDPMLATHFKREKWYAGKRRNVKKLLTGTEKENIAFLRNYKFNSGVQ